MTQMEPREIVRRTLEFDYPGRMCLNLWDGPDDIAPLPLLPPKDWTPAEAGIDEWGCIWIKSDVDNMGQVKGHPLADFKLMDEFDWPAPEDPSRYRAFPAALSDAYVQERFVGAGMGHGIFERTWMLHGFQATLEDLMLRPKEIHRLVDRVTDIHVRACRAISQHSGGRADFYSILDDLGYQRGPFFSMQI
jgi:hypothetical protein